MFRLLLAGSPCLERWESGRTAYIAAAQDRPDEAIAMTERPPRAGHGIIVGHNSVELLIRRFGRPHGPPDRGELMSDMINIRVLSMIA